MRMTNSAISLLPGLVLVFGAITFLGCEYPDEEGPVTDYDRYGDDRQTRADEVYSRGGTPGAGNIPLAGQIDRPQDLATARQIETINIVLSEEGITMPSHLEPGNFELRVSNNGTSEQRFEISGSGLVADLTGKLQAGDSQRFPVILREGEYVAYALADGERSPGETLHVSTSATGQARQVEIVLDEFAIKMPTRLPEGDYVFRITNNDTAEHGFEIESLDGKKLVSSVLEPGRSERFRVALNEGDYRVSCPVGKHDVHGMEMQLTVGLAAQRPET